jgi:hypothetical protein
LKPNFPLVLLALALVTGLRADGTVEVVSTPAANVYLDGELIGQSPLTASGIPPGSHEIGIENPSTGELKTYIFQSPKSISVAKRFEADFSATASTTIVPAPPPQRVVWTSTSTQPVVVSPAPPPRRSNVERAKTHTRNSLLGLTVASQVMAGNSRDRKRYRNVGLGLTLLNEVLR